jgi:hypothetical protein
VTSQCHPLQPELISSRKSFPFCSMKKSTRNGLHGDVHVMMLPFFIAGETLPKLLRLRAVSSLSLTPEHEDCPLCFEAVLDGVEPQVNPIVKAYW